MPDVESGEAGTVFECVAHGIHLRRVEVAYIKVGQTMASIEHGTHIGDIRRIPILQADDGSQVGAFLKHANHVCDI